MTQKGNFKFSIIHVHGYILHCELCFLVDCPEILTDSVDIQIQDNHTAIIVWQIDGEVTHVVVQSCDQDGNILPCVNTTVSDFSAPAVVGIPPGAKKYTFELYMFYQDDLVQSYMGEDSFQVVEVQGMSVAYMTASLVHAVLPVVLNNA
jgi:hypothetical protein